MLNKFSLWFMRFWAIFPDITSKPQIILILITAFLYSFIEAHKKALKKDVLWFVIFNDFRLPASKSKTSKWKLVQNHRFKWGFISQNEILSYVDSDFNFLKKIASFGEKQLLNGRFEVFLKEICIKNEFWNFFFANSKIRCRHDMGAW